MLCTFADEDLSVTYELCRCRVLPTVEIQRAVRAAASLESTAARPPASSLAITLCKCKYTFDLQQ